MGIPGIIRPCAFSFVCEGDRVLVGRFSDQEEGQYYRPLGGGIEFGETGEQAIRREFREELGVEIDAVQLLGFVENLFEIRGEPYHELCMVFAAVPDGWSIDRFDGFTIPDSSGPRSDETAVVRRIDELGIDHPVYPPGVIELLHGIELLP